VRADRQENERVRAASLDALSRYGPSTFAELMHYIGPAYSGRDSGSTEGRRLDRALQFHRRQRRIEYDRPNRCWRAVL
jgi:hypothetical protein